MEIYSFETLPSTQHYLVEKIREDALTVPVAVISKEQDSGVGSRENSWSGGEGNFFASFAVELKQLPEDLPLSSASIYFAFIMKKVLDELGERVWLKWPNDLYVDNEKVGGIITQKVKNSLVCGIGINLKKSPDGFRSLYSELSADFLLEKYLEALEKFPKWKQIFSEYRIEFEQSRRFSVHIENYQKSLQNALLCEDGSLLIEGKRVFSLR
ncbi:MAG: biotin--[acetyl-CoA-carboxylase] ligase [Campylobacteraceae bacterium 4484_4]|nr:MAG: biotin--[acetyl-CoA-carboxylase] ligase [Campylobacteraceae bacterium 4484_4]